MQPLTVGGIIWYGLVFIAGASILGLPVTISALLIGLLSGALVVVVFLVIISLLAWRWRKCLIILSVAFAVGVIVLISSFLPLSVIVLVAWVLFSGDPAVERLYDSLTNAPPLGARIGSGIGAFIWAEYLYCAFAAVGVTSPRVHTKGYSRAPLILLGLVATISACILGFSTLWSVTGMVFFITTFFLFLAILVVFGLFFIFEAKANYRGSTVVQRLSVVRTAHCHIVPWAIHLSDIHVTRLSGKTVEGGAGGNQRLQDAIVRMHSFSSLSFVFITGDLTDHGEPEEWTEAVSAIRSLGKHTQVLIAPGNHDLSVAYNPSCQFYSLISPAYGPGPPLKFEFEYATGTNMLHFLENLRMLNCEVRTSDGQELTKHTHLAMLDAAKNLYQRIASNPDEGPKLIACFSRSTHVARLCDPDLMEHELLRAYKAHLNGFSRGPFIAFGGSWIFNHWSDYFPLYQFDMKTSTHCLILNSVVTDISLIGSAFGVVHPDQITRLELLLNDSNARNIVILIHHAPFRWIDEQSPSPFSPRDLAMWGSLAATHGSGEHLFKILEAASCDGRQVLLLCGHRHGGQSRENRVGRCGSVLVAEAAALADASAMEFLAFSDDSTRLRPGLL